MKASVPVGACPSVAVALAVPPGTGVPPGVGVPVPGVGTGVGAVVGAVVGATVGAAVAVGGSVGIVVAVGGASVGVGALGVTMGDGEKVLTGVPRRECPQVAPPGRCSARQPSD